MGGSSGSPMPSLIPRAHPHAHPHPPRQRPLRPRGRRPRIARPGPPVHRGPARLRRRLAPLPGHQGRAAPTASPAGRRTRRSSARRPAPPTARRSAPTAGSIFCEQNGRRVSRMKPDGSCVETVVEEFDGKRLNSPNDIVARSDGHLYFTDPPYGVPARPRAALPGRLRPRPAGRTTSSCSSRTSRSPTAWPSRPTSRPSTSATRPSITSAPSRSSRPASSTPPPAGSSPPTTPDPGGPDGMKVDLDGRVYVAVAQGVWVYEPDGRLLGIIPTPARPSNLAWRGQDGVDPGDHGRRQGPPDQAQGLGPPARAAGPGRNISVGSAVRTIFASGPSNRRWSAQRTLRRGEAP